MIIDRLFYCHATEELYTIADIERFREMSIEAGDTFATGDIESYINVCLVENNGELEEVKPVTTIYDHGKAVLTVWNIKTDLF